jgi:hypothetical protein
MSPRSWLSRPMWRRPVACELGRGRDDGCPPPPAQTRARAPNAHGSHLGNRHARPVLGPHALPKDWSCRDCLARCPASAQCSGISLADRLPSMRSANGSPPLFAHFAGTMQSLDSPPPCMEDLWLIAFSSRPAYCHGRRRGLPVLAHGVSLHAWGLRLRGAAPCSRFRNSALLPSVLPDAVGSPKRKISELNTQPADTPVQRFKCDVAAALTWLGARVVRYTFPVRLFHSLLHAGLSRRYPGKIACPTEQPSRLPPACPTKKSSRCAA